MFEYLANYVLPRLVRQGHGVLMAVSGGPDSLAMADILHRYRRCSGLAGSSAELVVIHVHHGLRREADDEEKLVRGFARERELPLVVHRFDGRAQARLVKKSLQEAVREWRYACFAKVMRDRGLSCLATAHHMNDQAETLLYRLMRGSGASGLAGIWPDRLEMGWGRQEDVPAIRVIRPLLGVTKHELETYCHQRGITFARDSSNESPHYTRNRIRLELIPQMEREYNPRLQHVLSHTAEVMQWDESFFGDVVAEKWLLYGYELQERAAVVGWEAWQEPEAILSRLLRRALALIRRDPRGLDLRFVKELMERRFSRGWSQDFPGVRVYAAAEGLVLLNPSGNRRCGDEETDTAAYSCEDEAVAPILEAMGLRQSFRWDKERLVYGLPDSVLTPGVWHRYQTEEPRGLTLSIGLFHEDQANQIRDHHTQTLAEALLDTTVVQGGQGPVEFRVRRPGDSIFLAGVGHKRMKKIWQEHAVPVGRRDKIKVLAVASLVLAIPELGLAGQPEDESAQTERWVLLLRRLH